MNAVKNTVPVLKDKFLTLWWDLSAGLAVAGGTGVAKFYDPNYDYEVVEINLVPTVTVTNTSTSIKIGTLADDDHFFVNANVAGSGYAVGTKIPLTLTGTKKLAKGSILTAISTGTANTGEALIEIRLRPYDTSGVPPYESGKYPQVATATS